ncbi:methyltransferase family protein [Microbacterium nymphoidis]|uniref:methyltransferase family protein n=1 Tax=Microbacterium nymphoidis TaxID=2898586 RepID=UPI001E61BA1F|nr:isoprenylcysteine carboxylmethyltransferase family protein [Microbacterium nymphoidis]MCD2498373.1 isoprenylcysteine carboxylmethyltransferase family protein [Microbacterium nymphoidis]
MGVRRFDVSMIDARWARGYFAVQALAGALWWIAVFTIPPVRAATLGDLDAGLIALADIPLFVGGSLLAVCGPRWSAWIITPWTLLVTAGMALYATLTTQAGWGALLMVAASAGSVAAGVVLLLNRVPAEWIFQGPFRIRPARGTGARHHLLNTAAQIVVFWAVLLWLVPIAIRFIEERWRLDLPVPGWVRIAGVVLFAAAAPVGLWSAAVMASLGEGTPLPAAAARDLVVVGPYRVVRNPMAVAGIGQGVASGLILGSWLVVLYALAGALIWNWLVRPGEEADLEARFGEPFRRYRDSVNCWFPRLRRSGVRTGSSAPRG